MLHVAVDEAFDQLLEAWRDHWLMQRRPRVAVEVLAESRLQLDRARERMRRLRLAIHPELDECETIVDSVWCETLETVIHLRWENRHRSRPGNFECACGGLVPIDWDRIERRSTADDGSGEPGVSAAGGDASGVRRRRRRTTRVDRSRSD